MNREVCNNCRNDMNGRAEGECCNICLFYDKIWEEELGLI